MIRFSEILRHFNHKNYNREGKIYYSTTRILLYKDYIILFVHSRYLFMETFKNIQICVLYYYTFYYKTKQNFNRLFDRIISIRT